MVVGISGSQQQICTVITGSNCSWLPGGKTSETLTPANTNTQNNTSSYIAHTPNSINGSTQIVGL